MGKRRRAPASSSARHVPSCTPLMEQTSRMPPVPQRVHCETRSISTAPGARFNARLKASRPLLLTTVALTAVALLACSKSPESDGAAKPSILLRGNGPDPDSLDPQRARSIESQNVLRDLCEGLTTLSQRGSP